MKVEIINKPMLCWDNDESQAKEWHVLAKVTECDTKYPFKAISNENTYQRSHSAFRGCRGWDRGFEHAKPLPETIELTVAEISKLLGKEVKIVE